MPPQSELQGFREEVRSELEGNILPYWLSLKDPQGGFFGEAGPLGEVHPDAPRGAVLNARLLWTFSAVYTALGGESFLEAARWAYAYFTAHFLDGEEGGVFWSVAADGTPLEDKKQLYVQGFAIYGLSEYYRATGDSEALEAACRLFRCVESHFADPGNGGYFEALNRSFGPLEDRSLSAHDINADKTMNSHLHLLEAYANLYSVWPDALLGEKVRSLLEILCHRILHPSGHLQLYFDNAWHPLPGAWSYGHDIETSWLALECARTLGDSALCEEVSGYSRRLAAAGNEGLQDDGSMMYERHPDGSVDAFREWWVQAEAVVGNLWAWKYGKDAGALERALGVWHYIQRNLVDPGGGEWYWGIHADGTPDFSRPKAGFWKCPYHNTRMCLQVLSLT